jgi:hypothetical protein
MAQRLQSKVAPIEEEIWDSLRDDFEWGERSAAVVVLLTGVVIGVVLGFMTGAWLI